MLGTHHETWTPDATAIDHANLTAVINDLGFDSYEDLYHWSVESRPEFWEMVIDRRGLEWRVVRLDAGDPLPEAEDVSGVAILGGPMGVRDDEEFPFLLDEVLRPVG
jgi:hypothetical protein